jgi:hypothetical protein
MTSISSSKVVAIWLNFQVTTNSTKENLSCERDSKSAGQEISHFYDIRMFITCSQQYYITSYLIPVYVGLLYDQL